MEVTNDGSLVYRAYGLLGFEILINIKNILNLIFFIKERVASNIQFCLGYIYLRIFYDLRLFPQTFKHLKLKNVQKDL